MMDEEATTKGQWYKCSLCRGLFIKAVDDIEAANEFMDNFPHMIGEKACLVCATCYERFMRWYNAQNRNI